MGNEKVVSPLEDRIHSYSFCFYIAHSVVNLSINLNHVASLFKISVSFFFVCVFICNLNTEMQCMVPSTVVFILIRLYSLGHCVFFLSNR